MLVKGGAIMITNISCTELHASMQCDPHPVLIDVLPPEVYECCHLPNAVNACVYEMVFLDRVASLVASRESPIVLYDATGSTRAAVAARDKLSAAGYRSVRVLDGGLTGWAARGYQLVGAQGLPPLPRISDGRYRLDTTNSVLEWTGRNLTKRHYGRIAFSGGELELLGGNLKGGTISLDMTSITDLDLHDAEYQKMLVSHLCSEDFFAVERYPTASITFTDSQPISGATPGNANYTLSGRITIRDVTRAIAFPATIAAQEDASINGQAAFDIDRTLWNVSYGSGKLFERLGMHLVHDLVSLELFITAIKISSTER
jgi:polyisoprenoid-binding protein YceI